MWFDVTVAHCRAPEGEVERRDVDDIAQGYIPIRPQATRQKITDYESLPEEGRVRRSVNSGGAKPAPITPALLAALA